LTDSLEASSGHSQWSTPPEPNGAATDAELKAVFGLRAEYYIARWHGTATWRPNWAAFFCTGSWLVFRRMYAGTAFLYLAVMAEVFVERIVLASLGYTAFQAFADRLRPIGIAIVCGALGNGWYLRHVRRLLTEVRALALPEEEHLREVARRGRTRPTHVLVAALLFVLALVALVRGAEFLKSS
jgi:Protein of unknown function (DUF2628)